MATEQKRDLSKYENQLRTLYARLRGDQEDVEDLGLHGNLLDESGDSEGHSNHPGDLATDLYLRERDQFLEGNLDAILSQCERALRKIEDGTYGYSDQSGEFIGEERLEAIPYANLTAAEQERIDAI